MRQSSRHPRSRVECCALVALLAAACSVEKTSTTRAHPSASAAPIVLKTPLEPIAATTPWSSAASCETALVTGKRAGRRPGTARIGSWNIQWFPDGTQADEPALGTKTFVEWVACAIAFLEVDVIAIQEIKDHERARAELRRLERLLGERASGSWKSSLDRCGTDSVHIGFLYDERRVKVVERADHGSVNPNQQGKCDDDFRPAHSLYLEFPGGLDLHAAVLHLPASSNRERYDARKRAWARLPELARATRALEPDDDLVLLGDFNTIGCKDCNPVVTDRNEIVELEQALGRLKPPLVRLENTVACTEYQDQGSFELDHVVVARGMAELPASSRASVYGLCAESRCAQPGAVKRAQRGLSDHCPIVVELVDRDVD